MTAARDAASLLLYHVRRLHDPATRDAAARYIWDAYYDRLRGFFRGRNLPPEMRHDLIQETFLRVFRGRGEFGTREEFEGWLVKIAANVYRNYQRSLHAQKRDAQEQSLEEWEEEHGAGVPEPADHRSTSPLEVALEHELEARLAKALLLLPPQNRRCLVLRVGQHRTYQEIADMLGISVGTVKAHLYQAKKRLRELLAPDRERDEPSDPTGSER